MIGKLLNRFLRLYDLFGGFLGERQRQDLGFSLWRHWGREILDAGLPELAPETQAP